MPFVIEHRPNTYISGLGAFLRGQDEAARGAASQQANIDAQFASDVGRATSQGVLAGGQFAALAERQQRDIAAQAEQNRQAQQASASMESQQQQFQSIQNRMERDRALTAMPAWTQSKIVNNERQIVELRTNPEYQDGGSMIDEANQKIQDLEWENKLYYDMYPPPPEPSVDMAIQSGKAKFFDQMGNQSESPQPGGFTVTLDRWNQPKIEQHKTEAPEKDKSAEQFQKIFDDELKAYRESNEFVSAKDQPSLQQQLQVAHQRATERQKMLLEGPQANVAQPGAGLPPPFVDPRALQGSQPGGAGAGLWSSDQDQPGPQAGDAATTEYNQATAIIADKVESHGDDVSKWPSDAVRVAAPSAVSFLRMAPTLAGDIHAMPLDARKRLADELELAQEIVKRASRADRR